MNAAAAAYADLYALDDPEALAGFTRWRADGGAESSLRLAGMHCAACAGLIEAALGGVAGVESVRVNAALGLARVHWHPAQTQASALVRAVRAAGYDAAPDLAADARALRERDARLALWRLFVALFCAMQVMMLATPIYLAGPGDMAPDQQRLLQWGSWLLTLPVLLFAAVPFFSGAWYALRQHRIGMDLPVALGIAVTFVASTGAAFDPGGVFGTEVYFDSLAMFVSFLLGARWLEQQARHRAARALEERAAAVPQRATRVLDDGRTEQIPASRLAVGDQVRVSLGATFPADGTLLGAATAVNESLLTGESRPLTKHAGDELLAGSINIGAPVDMRVTRCALATRHAAIVELVRDAMLQRPQGGAGADRWAAPFLLGVIVLAALAAAVWSVVEPARALWVAVSVLIVTCPCALSLASPSALLTATGHLARRGVLMRRPQSLDTMARVQTLILDKTGTLTEDQPILHSVQRIAMQDGADIDELHRAAAALAAWSSHPLSRAIARIDATAAPAWAEVQELPGAGVRGRDAQGREWRLGSAAFVGCPRSTDDALHLWYGHGGEAWLRFDFDEALRPGAARAIADIQALGIEVRILSGDRDGRVRRLADQLGVASAAGDATPQGKLAALRAAQADGRVVAMLGDGINDAPVLAQADVSLAMGEGADIARQSADAVLLSMRLGDVAHAFALARRTRRVVGQNMAWALAYNLACIPLALLGLLPPWLAGLGMATSSLVVVGNALRLAK